MRAEAGGGRRGVDITHRQTVLHKSLVYVKMRTRVKTLSPALSLSTRHSEGVKMTQDWDVSRGDSLLSTHHLTATTDFYPSRSHAPYSQHFQNILESLLQ